MSILTRLRDLLIGPPTDDMALSTFPEPPDAGVWVTVLDNGPTRVEHLDGVEWMRAPVPPREHRCAPQTRGWSNYFTLVERCPCGGMRVDKGIWIERNSR